MVMVCVVSIVDTVPLMTIVDDDVLILCCVIGIPWWPLFDVDDDDSHTMYYTYY